MSCIKNEGSLTVTWIGRDRSDPRILLVAFDDQPTEAELDNLRKAIAAWNERHGK